MRITHANERETIPKRSGFLHRAHTTAYTPTRSHQPTKKLIHGVFFKLPTTMAPCSLAVQTVSFLGTMNSCKTTASKNQSVNQQILKWPNLSGAMAPYIRQSRI